MIRRMLGAAKLDADTYEEVEKDGGATLQALVVVIVVSLANVVGKVLGGGEDAEVIGALSVGIYPKGWGAGPCGRFSPC